MMLLYRVTLAKYAHSLKASGRAARWNSNDREVIYTSSSRALACLENIVHRSQLGLTANFRLLSIELPDDVPVRILSPKELPLDWPKFGSMPATQAIGDGWLEEGRYPVLKVPSSIIPEEYNYLFNPKHADFKKVRLVGSEPFTFDTRIKRA